MYFSSPEELKNIAPIRNGVWNKEYLFEYLVWSNATAFEEYINAFFQGYTDNEDLIDLLFDFLLSDSYEGSDSQMAAAHYISKMDRQLLKDRKSLLLQAQASEILWKRPFPHDEHLDWL